MSVASPLTFLRCFHPFLHLDRTLAVPVRDDAVVHERREELRLPAGFQHLLFFFFCVCEAFVAGCRGHDEIICHYNRPSFFSFLLGSMFSGVDLRVDDRNAVGGVVIHVG